MTKAELIERLKLIAKDDQGKEGRHVDADVALLEYINDPEVTAAYKAIAKWYV